jgi:hypothetical protein
LQIFLEGFKFGLILPMELKNCGLMGIGKCKLKEHYCISQKPASWKPSYEITTDTNGQFSKNTNRRRRGILELRPDSQSQELELETLAPSRAALSKTGPG